MKIRQRTIKRARIEIIPMIDVIFFLLVFFMITSLAMTRMNSIPVSLPKSSSNPNALKQVIILTIKLDGSIFINKVPVTIETLSEQLANAMHDNPQDALIINGDMGSNYGLVIKVMDRARQTGVRKFALATEPEQTK